MIKFRVHGNFDKFEKFLSNAKRMEIRNLLNRIGGDGVNALRNNTPKDSGATANSWRYEIQMYKNKAILAWFNDEVTTNGVPIAILLQYGHGTRGGTFVQGRDFINPAMKPIFEKMVDGLGEELAKI